MARAKLSEEERKARRKESKRKYNSSAKGKAKTADYNRRWNDANRDQRNALNRDWYANNTQSVLDQKRFAAYGLTAEQYTAMLVAQDFKCAICRTDKPVGRGGLHVDHCHDTKKVRALLCMECNTGIGKLKHDAELLRAAADYIEKYSDDVSPTDCAVPRLDEQQQPARQPGTGPNLH